MEHLPYLFDLVGPSTPDGIFTGLAAGTYTATVNDDNGCAATSLTVTITEPDVLTVSAGSNTPVCSGTSLNLTSTPTGGTSGYSYAWTGPNGPVPAVQNPTIASATAADAGQYDVLITDAHGCTSTGSHTVQVNAAPTAAIALSGSPNKCLGQSATVINIHRNGTMELYHHRKRRTIHRQHVKQSGNRECYSDSRRSAYLYSNSNRKCFLPDRRNHIGFSNSECKHSATAFIRTCTGRCS